MSMLLFELGSFTKGNKRGDAMRGGRMRKSRLFFEEEETSLPLWNVEVYLCKDRERRDGVAVDPVAVCPCW